MPLSFSGPCLVRFQNTSKDGDSTTSLSGLWHCSVTFRVMFRWNFPYFSLYILPLLLSLGITTSLYEYSFHLPIRYLYTLIRSTLSFLQAEQFYFCSSMMDVSRPESSALDKLSPVCPCCSFIRRSRAGPSTPDASLVLTGKAGLPPSACWECSTYCSPGCCCPSGARACCWLILQIWQKWFSPSLWTTYCFAFVTSSLPAANASLNQSDSTLTISGLFPTAPPALAVAFVGALVSWLSLKAVWRFVGKTELFPIPLSAPWKASPSTFADWINLTVKGQMSCSHPRTEW